MAEVHVLVEDLAAMEFARQAGKFGSQAALPADKSGRVEALRRERHRLVQREHAAEFLDGEKPLQAEPGTDRLPRGARPGYVNTLRGGPLEVLPFLQSRRPRPIRKQRRQESQQTGQTVVPFEVDDESVAAVIENAAADRPPLFLVESVGDRFRHDARFPAVAGKAVPIVRPAIQVRASTQSPPQRRHGVAHRRRQAGRVPLRIRLLTAVHGRFLCEYPIPAA